MFAVSQCECYTEFPKNQFASDANFSIAMSVCERSLKPGSHYDEKERKSKSQTDRFLAFSIVNLPVKKQKNLFSLSRMFSFNLKQTL